MYKKTVILQSLKNCGEKAVLTLEKAGNSVSGVVRLYNFNSAPKGILSMGILCENEVVKVALSQKCDMQYTINFLTDKSLSAFSCAIINVDNGIISPILQGATGERAYEEKLAGALKIFEEEATVLNVEKHLNENKIELEENAEIKNQIEECFSEDECDLKCSSCKYRDAFYKQDEKSDLNKTENSVLDEAENHEEINQNEEQSFFDGVKEQIDSLFNKYPEEDFLADIIPNSKWVKIDYESNGEYYVIGLMYEERKIKYICYGVPGMYSSAPPKELEGFSQWLPIDSTKPEGFGYWLTYQDADSGENVKMNFNVV